MVDIIKILLQELFPINFNMSHHIGNIINKRKSIYVLKVNNPGCKKNIVYVSDSKFFFFILFLYE